MTEERAARRAVDRAKAAALSRRVGTDFGAALAVALAYVGDRLGLFRAMADGTPLTPRELAERTGLAERYVREWAATMAASGYVEYLAADGAFRMTAEQATVLVEERSPFFMAGAFQYAQACVRQVPRLMEAFRKGGGVPFADFGPEIVEAIERLFQAGYETFVASQWLPAAPDVHRALLDGGEAAEVGCGAGQCLVPVARAYPRSRFVGYDVDRGSLERAARKAAEAGVAERVVFEALAAEDLPDAPRFDLVMAFNCVHDMANPRGALRGIRRALKDEAALLWSEAKVSDRLEENLSDFGRSLYAASTMHCMTVSLAQGGEGLGTVVGEERARELAIEAGFARFEVLPVENPYHRIFLVRKARAGRSAA